MLSTTAAVSRMIKAQDPDAVTVFVGPCVAKKSEVVDQKIEGNADYVLTYSEMRAIMSAKGVELADSKEASRALACPPLFPSFPLPTTILMRPRFET